MSSFLYRNELTEAYQAIENQGGYHNQNSTMIPFHRFFQTFSSKKDFYKHALTITGSLTLALTIPLPCLFMAISAIFQCVAAFFHLNINQITGYFKDGVETFGFGCVVTTFLMLNVLAHALSLLTRALTTAAEFLYEKMAPKSVQAL